MKLLSVTLLALACALPGASFAQWQWLDKDGRKVYSDRSPPADIPAKNILKQPGGAAAAAAAEATLTAASAPAPTATASAPKLSGKDKELEEKKKQAQAAEAEKKRASEEESAKARTDSCNRAKRAKATFDSGIRIATTNDKGEREVLDDKQRAAEGARLEKIIASDCKTAGS